MEILEKFSDHKYPNISKISDKTGLTQKQVRNWFDRKKYQKKPDENSRKHFPLESRQFLEACYKKNQRPSDVEISDYAERLELSEAKIKQWFARRRFTTKQIIMSDVN